MKFKKMAAIGLACVTVMTSALSVQAEIKNANQDPANTEKTDETLRIALSSEPSSIWPAGDAKTEEEAMIITSTMTDTLVKKNYATGEVSPNLAESWEWVDDTHCRFVLRDDVTMTDGTPLVAEDVVYDVTEIWIGINASNDTGRFLKGAVAEDEHTVTIEFTTAAPDLIQLLAWTNFGIVTQQEVEAVGGPEEAAKNPLLGCGKYKFVEWVSGQSITVTRNEDYWNDDYVGYYKNIVFTFTNDAAARAMAVQSGDIDIAIKMPSAQVSTYADSEDVQAISYTYGQVNHLWYNMTEEHATSDLRVREAIDLALDFDAIAQVATGGYGEAALGYFTPDTTSLYSETYTAEERAVDVDKAKALLEEAGYADGLDITTVCCQDDVLMYTVIQENLRAIGINLTINSVDTAQFVQDAFAGNYDIIAVGEDSSARYPTLFFFMDQESIDSGYVIGGPKVTTEELDAKISELISETDTDKAKTVAGEIEQMMKEQCIMSNLYVQTAGSIINKDLKGYNTLERSFIDPTGFYK